MERDSTSGGNAALTAVMAMPAAAAKIVSLTPGLSYAVTPRSNVYALLQLPLYQSVNGEQLTASKSLTVGINHRF